MELGFKCFLETRRSVTYISWTVNHDDGTKSTEVAALLAAHSKEAIANLWNRLLACFSGNRIKYGEYEMLHSIQPSKSKVRRKLIKS